MVDCDHKKTTTLSLGSLWGPFETFCADCGVCTSNKDVEPRPASVREISEREAEWTATSAYYEAMTPAEKEAHAEALVAGIEESLKRLADQLRPFQQPHNCFRSCDCGR